MQRFPNLKNRFSYNQHYQAWSQYYKKNNWDAALSAISKCIELDPKNANAYCQRGHTQARRGKRQEAIQDYNQALAMTPENQKFAIHYERCMGFGILKDYQAVFKEIQEVIKRNKGYANGAAYRQLGYYYSRQQNYKEAITAFKEYLKFSPLDRTRQQLVATAQKNLSDMQTKFHLAATTGNLQSLQKMLGDYPGLIKLTNPSNGQTPLHGAAATGQIEAMKYLINQGADLNAKCLSGFNAMDYAIYYNKPEAVRFLYSKGLVSSLKLGSGDYVPSLVLPTIINEKKIFVLDCTGYEMPVDFSLFGSSDYAVFGRLGTLNFSTLNTASKCQAALQDISTYLRYLYNYTREFSDPTTISARTEECKFANTFWKVKKREVQKMTEVLSVKGGAQHYIAHKGYVQILEYFIQIGASLNYADTLGNTPLHVAAASGQLPCVKAMLEKAVPAKNYCDATGHALTIKEFINKPNKEGLTALQLAAIKGQVEVMQYLISLGADLNAKSKAGWNIAQYAYYYKQTKALNWLQSIKEISIPNGKENLVVRPHPNSSTQWTMTYTAPSKENFSFYVKECQPKESHAVQQEMTKNNSAQGVSVLLSSSLIEKEMQNLSYLPATDRKPVAVAMTGAKMITDFHNTLSQSTDNANKFVVKDKTNNAQEKTYSYQPAIPSHSPPNVKLEASLDALKVGQSAVSKTVEVVIENNPLSSSGKMIANGTVNTVSGIFNSFVCVGKELSDGNDIKSALMTCGGKQIKDIAKGVTETIVSHATVKALGTLVANNLAKTVGGIAGIIAGELIFNDPLNPTETASIPKDKMLAPATQNKNSSTFFQAPAIKQQLHVATKTALAPVTSYIKPQLVVKPLFSQANISAMQKSIADHDPCSSREKHAVSTSSQSAESYFQNNTFYSPSSSSSVVTSSGGSVTTGSGGSVTTGGGYSSSEGAGRDRDSYGRPY